MIRGYRVRSLENRSRITEVARRLATLCIEDTKLIAHLYHSETGVCNKQHTIQCDNSSSKQSKIKNDYTMASMILDNSLTGSTSTVSAIG